MQIAMQFNQFNGILNLNSPKNTFINSLYNTILVYMYSVFNFQTFCSFQRIKIQLYSVQSIETLKAKPKTKPTFKTSLNGIKTLFKTNI